MAHRILGIDLGAYSVKVIVVQPGFRSAAVTDFIERQVPPGDDPYEVRAARVLGSIVREHKLNHDFPYASLAGDKLFIHILKFPFRSLRRIDLERAVGAELEGILPLDLEDMVFGFEGLPHDLRGPVAPGAAASDPMAAPPANIDDSDNGPQVQPRPARAGLVAEPPDGMRVLACAMETTRARDLLELISDSAAEPRGLVAAPASYARVVERIAHLADGKGRGDGAPVAIIDIGHERTNICVVQSGRAVYARTIQRGGRHLTETISRTWRISYEEAETAKHKDGFIGSATEPAKSEDWQRVHEVVVTEIGPLARDIKRTLTTCRARTGASISEAVLVGGGSRLRGLPAFLAEKLHLPVSHLTDEDTQLILGNKLIQQGVPADVTCLAAGVAFEGATGRPHFDLRQGELAYKADLSFLRQKATSLATVLLVVIFFAAINAYAALYKLRTAEANLDTRLALETTELFGESLNAEEALLRTAGKTGAADSPLPKLTAYDILLEVSKALPERKDVTINVGDLEIRPGKITIRASAASNAEIDKIEDGLKKVECFKEVSRGSTSVGTNDVRNFSLSIKANCM